MIKRGLIVGLVGIVASLLSGCFVGLGVPLNPHAVLAKNASIVDNTVQELFEALDTIGAKDAKASSLVYGCQSSPVPGVAYEAGISAYVGDDLVGPFNAFREQLEDFGWKMTHDLRGKEPDPNRPAWRFERGNIWVSVFTGGTIFAGEVLGAGKIRINVRIPEKGCIRYPEKMDIPDFRDLEKTIYPRS